MGSEDVAALIAAECDAVKAMLLAKNKAYGNSALEPLRVFSRLPADAQIKVRLDDKLSRLARGSGEETEDVEADIVGYLILMRVHRRMVAEPGTGPMNVTYTAEDLEFMREVQRMLR